MKTNIAVFFGCRSVEHEVSIISAVQAMRAINREKYDVTPIYVTKNGEMYTGENLFTIENYRDLPALLKAAEPVTFIKQGGSKGMASLGRKIPADLPDDKSEEIRKLACDVFKAINASGVVRIDFMIDCDTDKVYANEINTIPGSLAFYLWEATGLKYTDMIDRLAEVAFRRQRERENLTFTIDTNILSGVSFGAKGAKGAKL